MRSIIISLIFVIYFLFAFFYTKNTFANGDEVHYLLATRSLVYDHDLWLENNYAQGDALLFNPEVRDEIAATGLDGHLYPVHGIGYSLLLTPFYALAGRLGAVFFNVAISAALFVITYLFTKKITQFNNLSLTFTSVVFLSIPIFNLTVLNFTEITGAFLFMTVVYYLLADKLRSFPIVLSFCLLPWIHIRYLPIAILLYPFFLWRLNKCQKYLALLPLLSIIGYLTFLKITFGSFNPFTPYTLLGHLPPSGHPFQNTINLLIDRQYGLFIYNPLFLFVIPGFFLWYKKNKISFFLILLIISAYLFPVILKGTWQGYTPPGRLLVPILPLAIPALVFFSKQKNYLFYHLIGVLFYSWGILNMIVALLLPPNHGFVSPNGIAPSLQFLSIQITIDIQSFFPAFYPTFQFSFLHYLWILVIIVFWKSVSYKL